MEAGAALLLLVAFLGTASTLSFYGDSISFMPPQKKADGTFKVDFYHRQNCRSSFQDQSSFTCDGGACQSLDKSSVLQTDQDGTGQGRWCQAEGRTTATVTTNQTSFSLTGLGCCWLSNVEGTTGWTSHAELDLGTRSDSYALNSCPVTTTMSALRVPQNCFSRLRLLAHDPDGDEVRCRFAANAAVPSNFNLEKTACVLTSAGTIQIGVHVFELMMEDFPVKNITLTYADGTTAFHEASKVNSAPLCKVKLQFSLEVLPPIPSCESGHTRPVFLSRTPSHGEVLHATVGELFSLFAEARAQHVSIKDFQVSGPQNMTKVFKDDTLGAAEVTLSWTPQHSDLFTFVPVCFTAETNETQSEMRCVVVMVTQASIIQGKANVQCSPNKMVVTLEKTSMPDIDVNFLELRDRTCSLTSNSTHIMASMSLKTCGTQFEDKGDFIVFSNEINSFVRPKQIITRRRSVKISFSCRFPKTLQISNYYRLRNSDYIFTESGIGSFGYTFEIFRDGNFTNKVEPSAYPVEVKLLEMIYLGIRATSELQNVTLFVESCKATPDDNPDNPLFYDIIKRGCIKDDTVEVHSADPTQFNFGLQAFKFTGNYEQVYITCSVILCKSRSPFSRCAQDCVENEPSRRRRRGLSTETSSHYITQGPLQFVRQAEEDRNGVADKPTAAGSPTASPADASSGQDWEMKKLLSSNITTLVFASAFMVAVVLLALMVRYYSRKRKAEDTNALILSEWEN